MLRRLKIGSVCELYELLEVKRMVFFVCERDVLYLIMRCIPKVKSHK